MRFEYHTLYILIKTLFFSFLFLKILDIYFLYFSYTSNNTITFFDNYAKIFEELFLLVMFINLWFLLSFRYILLAHYLFEQTHKSSMNFCILPKTLQSQTLATWANSEEQIKSLNHWFLLSCHYIVFAY